MLLFDNIYISTVTITAGSFTWAPTSEPTWVPTWEPIATCRRQDVWSTEKCQSLSHKCQLSGPENEELWENCDKTCFCAPTSTTAATTGKGMQTPSNS